MKTFPNNLIVIGQLLLFGLILGLALMFPHDLMAKRGKKVDRDSLFRVAENTLSTPKEKANAIRRLARTYYRNEPGKALVFADSSIRMSIRGGFSDFLAYSYSTKYLAFGRLVELDSGIVNARLAANYARQHGDYLAEGMAWCAWGNFLEDQGKLEEANACYEQCLLIGNANERPKVIARAKINLGFINRIRANYVKALDYLYEAREICMEGKLNGYYSAISMNIGDIHRNQNELLLAKEDYKRALSESRSVNNQKRIAEMLLRLSEVEVLLGQEDTALIYLEECRRLGSGRRLSSERASAEARIADIFLRQGKLDSANYFAMASLEGFRDTPDSIFLAKSHEVMGRVLLALGQNSGAFRECSQCRDIAAIRSEIPELADGYHCLYLVEQKRGNPGASLLMFQEYIFWRDSLFNQGKTREVAEREAKEVYRQEAFQDSLAYQTEIESRQVEFDLREMRASRKFVAAVGTGAAVLLVAALLLFFFLTIRNKNRLLGRKNLEIEDKAQAISLVLEDKEVLLKEVHHRVKNNLQIISSLLEMQISQSSDSGARKALTEGQSRIAAMSIIHQMLYQNADLDRVEMKKYVENLVSELGQIFPAERQIKVETEVDEIFLDIDHAVPLGLIINELVTNSLKYAYHANPDPVMRIGLTRDDESYLLVIQDNGPGLPAATAAGASHSLGLKLVKGLVRQLEGTLEMRNAPGARFEIRF